MLRLYFKMEKETLARTPIKMSEWPWTVIVSVFGLIFLGVSYSFGDAYYNQYLGRFSISPDAFPIDHPRHLVVAVWGAVNATEIFNNWEVKHGASLVKPAVIVVLLYVAVVLFFIKFLSLKSNKAKITSRFVFRWLRNWPYFRLFLILTACILLVLPLFLNLMVRIMPIFAFPSVIGAAAGDYVADRDMLDFEKGCSKSSAVCYSVILNKSEIACGYVISQSADRAALYFRKGTVQLPLKDAELRTLSKSGAPGSLASACLKN